MSGLFWFGLVGTVWFGLSKFGIRRGLISVFFVSALFGLFGWFGVMWFDLIWFGLVTLVWFK